MAFQQLSGARIMLGLEDESGERKPIEIDEPDEDTTEDDYVLNKRKVSISKRLLISQRYQQLLEKTVSKEAEVRKNEFNALLLEHAKLVHDVEEMKKPATDSPKERRDSLCSEKSEKTEL